MTGFAARAGRLVAALLLAIGAVLAAPSAAYAEDAYDLEMWFYDNGYRDAYLHYDEARTRVGQDEQRRGIVFVLQYKTQAPSAATYTAEGRRAAERIWRRADYRVLKVVVLPNNTPSWATNLPETLSWDRAALERDFGTRPAGKDVHGVGDLDEDFTDSDGEFLPFLAFGLIVTLLTLLAPFVVGAAVGGLGVFLAVRRRLAPAPLPYAPQHWGIVVLAAPAGLLAQARELNNDTVTPGLLGLLVVVALGVALWVLVRSMNTQIRRIRFEEKPPPPRGDDAGEPPGSPPDPGPGAAH